MTAWAYLCAKWPASAKRWAILWAIGVPALGLVKGDSIGFGWKLIGLLVAAYLILTAFTWAVSAVALYAAGAYQSAGRNLPDWASKDAYSDD